MFLYELVIWMIKNKKKTSTTITKKNTTKWIIKKKYPTHKKVSLFMKLKNDIFFSTLKTKMSNTKKKKKKTTGKSNRFHMLNFCSKSSSSS